MARIGERRSGAARGTPAQIRPALTRKCETCPAVVGEWCYRVTAAGYTVRLKRLHRGR